MTESRTSVSGAEAPDRYTGLLLIGDPHLEARPPGFRKDDYPRVILQKLEWCLHYAKEHRLLPAILGDLFDKPRDNPNWVMHELVVMLNGTECIGIYGNHDCGERPELTEHDSFTLLVQAGCVRLVDADAPWRGVMNGRPVVVAGSSYRHALPKSFDKQTLVSFGGDGRRGLGSGTGVPSVSGDDGRDARATTQSHAADRSRANVEPLVVWLTHHDIEAPGYEEQARQRPRETPGVDLVVNGHIHRKLEDVVKGSTRWMTPGNISRRTRSDATRDHTPAVLRVDVTPAAKDADTDAAEGDGLYRVQSIELPHAAFDEVFHEAVTEDAVEPGASAFVTGLQELQTHRTQGGAGLVHFLKQNISQFTPDVGDEIMTLAKEVTDDAGQ